MISPSLAAYTAGLLDGEGSIQINPSKNGAKAVKSYWALSVQISTVGVDFLEPICAEWGLGRCTYWKSRGSRPGRRVCNWRLYALEAEAFLRAVQPYLRLKREHVQVALEFRSLITPESCKRGGLSPETSERRGILARRMRELNARTGKALASTSTTAL